MLLINEKNDSVTMILLYQVTFFGSKDHSLLTEYKVFVNPSLSEVLCTTILEVSRKVFM